MRFHNPNPLNLRNLLSEILIKFLKFEQNIIVKIIYEDFFKLVKKLYKS